MGRQTGDQSQLFYLFNLERRIPAGHLLRRINPVVTQILVELRDRLAAFYSDIGRPSIDPELMIRMLIVGYCYGIRFERRLREELELHLARPRRRLSPIKRRKTNSRLFSAGSKLPKQHNANRKAYFFNAIDHLGSGVCIAACDTTFISAGSENDKQTVSDH